MAKRNGVVEVAPKLEMKEDNTGPPHLVKDTRKRKSSRKVSRGTQEAPYISEMKKIYASLSASDQPRSIIGVSDHTCRRQQSRRMSEHEDGNTTNYEQEEPRKKKDDKKKDYHDSEDLNFLLLVRPFFHYLIVQGGFIASKNP